MPMARTSRRKDVALSEQLSHEAWRFDFFQAVRLLERIDRQRTEGTPDTARQAVGYDSPPEQEVVRFRALPARSFPAGSVSDIRPAQPAKGREPKDGLPPEMRVAFMGLTGPAGVLPERYLDLLLQRIRDRDFALRDFLDVFNHRTISLFYRAWEKYRFPATYERARLDGVRRDLFSWCLRSLVGTGTDHQQDRLGVDDEVLLYYGGHFSHQPRPAIVLERMIGDYFEIGARAQQFHGRWLRLDEEEQTRLPTREVPKGRHNRLSVDALLGEHVWDVQSAFRLRLGPLTYDRFCRLLPNGSELNGVASLTRMFVGPELDFEIQLVLTAAEVPACRLARTGNHTPHLGWNTWLCSSAPSNDAEDACFYLKDIGNPGTVLNT
jgi:type VI secretion system protein ImpH